MGRYLMPVHRKLWLLPVVITLLSGLSPVRAQQDHTFYFMSQVPQSAHLNPAYPSRCAYLGLPLLSSLHANLSNTGFSYNQLFPERGGVRVVDFQYLTESLHTFDLLNARVHTDLLSVGFPWRDHFITFRISEKAGAMVHYPKILFSLPWEGNRPYAGKTVSFDRMGVQLQHYREFSLAASRWLTDDLRGGIRLRLLFGKMNVSTRDESFELATRGSNYHILSRGNYRLDASLPVQLTTNSSGFITRVRLEDVGWSNYLLNGKNPGAGVDLGLVYSGLEDVTLYGSLLNLGMIRWTSQLNNFQVDHRFAFEGLSEDDLDVDDYTGMMRDSVENSFQVDRSGRSFTTFLPLHTYLGLTYQVNDYLKAGVLQHNLLHKWRIYPSFTFSLNTRVNENLSLHASYSWQSHSFRNLGAGFSIQTNHWQFYAAADNLLAIRPLGARNIHFRAGFNIFFGCGEKKARQGKGQPAQGAGCFWIRRRQANEKLLPH